MLQLVINLCMSNNIVMDSTITTGLEYLLMVHYIPSSGLFLLPSGKRTPPVNATLCPGDVRLREVRLHLKQRAKQYKQRTLPQSCKTQISLIMARLIGL